MAPVVQCMGLTKTYGRKIALNQINLNLERGRIIGLLGPNGSGKTTMIKIINGLLKPTAGEVLINGQPPAWIRSCGSLICPNGCICRQG